MSKKVTFAVVGCGHIGKRHAEMISRNSNCELLALCDDKDEAQFETKKYNCNFYKSIDELLN